MVKNYERNKFHFKGERQFSSWKTKNSLQGEDPLIPLPSAPNNATDFKHSGSNKIELTIRLDLFHKVTSKIDYFFQKQNA